jgi:murein tripeptide amidase MpaA
MHRYTIQIRPGILMILLSLCLGCGTLQRTATIQFENGVDTHDKPVAVQTKRSWSFGSLHFSNQFDCARLNDVMQVNDSTFIASIRPENTPVNPSPWYAFSIKEDSTRTRYVILDYGEEKHRYYPQIGRNNHFTRLDSASLFPLSEHQLKIRLCLSRDEVILAAQPIASATAVHTWMDSVSNVHGLSYRRYGKSREGRPLKFVEITDGTRHKPTIVLLSRQHPPEVTGWFTLQYFLLELLDDSALQQSFLKEYRVLVYPILNPDGVDRGFWRHNAGGVDLNRDWSYYRQPEIRHTVRHITKKCRKTGVVLALDFHSTHHDIFYTNDESQNPSALPHFREQWLNALRDAIPDQSFEERYSKPQTPVSKNWFYRFYNATALTYEIGDDTPRDIIELKGRNTAAWMMRILLNPH